MKCVICGSDHEVFHTDKSGYVHSVNDAVLCDSTGNYGSTKFDPLHGDEKLQFIVCDKCLVERAALFYVYRYHRPEPHQQISGYRTLKAQFELDKVQDQPE